MGWELPRMPEVPQRGGGGNSLKAVLVSLMAGSLLLGYFSRKFLFKILWIPYTLHKIMAAQGVKGPAYGPLYGNVTEMVALHKAANAEPMQLSHDIIPRVLPDYHRWVQAQSIIDLVGWKPRLILTDPKLIKEVLSNKFGHFEKIPWRPDTKHLIGNGLFNLEGETWAHHRRILNPAFHVETLKGMIPTMMECTMAMLTRWNELVQSGQKEVEMHAEFISLTADIISRTSFGSSYAEGHKVFKLQQELVVLAGEASHSVYIPGFRFFLITLWRYGLE